MKKRIPFDLEKAKQGAKIVNTFGTEYEFIRYVPHATESSRLVLMHKQSMIVFATGLSNTCLLIEVEEEVIWVNVFKDYMTHKPYIASHCFKSEAIARSAGEGNSMYVGTYSITV